MFLSLISFYNDRGTTVDIMQTEWGVSMIKIHNAKRFPKEGSNCDNSVHSCNNINLPQAAVFQVWHQGTTPADTQKRGER